MVTSSGSSEEELIGRLLDGSLSFHRLEDEVGEEDAVIIRRRAMEKFGKTSLEVLRGLTVKASNSKPNIENLIGSVEVPVGIAGPLLLHGQHARGPFYLPLATTEGALVASVSRGCRALQKAGGVKTEVVKDAQARSILFSGEDDASARRFVDWVRENERTLMDAAQDERGHLGIKSIETFNQGKYVWLRLSASTGDAMGMNMVTIAGRQAAEHILRHYPEITFLAETGNLCVDKKASRLSQEKGKGRWVTASANIPTSVLSDVLKTTPEKIVEVNHAKNHLGSELAGALGKNAHHANIVAALSIALGQDAAHTVDGSIGTTNITKTEDGIFAEVILPSLQVGTLGGGTGLPGQQACLKLLGVAGSGDPIGSNGKKLAEIFAGAVLAGELSLLGALTSRDLAKAHSRLNR